MTTKSRTLLALLFSCAALAACGGGGRSDEDASATAAPAPAQEPAPTPTPAPAPATSVSAPFVPGAIPAYLMFSVGTEAFGGLKTYVQQSEGAVTALNSYSLTGTPAVAEVAGDASFAMGRWAGGTVNTSTGTQTFNSNSAWHYLLYNAPAAFPDSAPMTCDTGNFTSPSYIGGASSSTNFGIAGGSARLEFAAGKATARLTLIVDAGSLASKNVVTLVTRGMISVDGNIGTGADTVYVTIGDAGNGAYAVQGAYELNLPNGARYAGVYRFRCH